MKKLIFVTFFSYLSFATTYTEKDVTAAKYISELERNLLKNNLNSKSIQLTKGYVRASGIFSRYESLLTTVENIISGKLKDCSTIKVDENLILPIENYISRFCYSKQLKQVYSDNISDKTKYETLKHYLINDKSKLTNFLLSKKVSELNKGKILELITEIVLEEDITIPQRLVEHIELNSHLTKLYQSKVKSSKKNKIILTKEFSRQVDSIDENATSKDLDAILNFHKANNDLIYTKTAWKKLILAAGKLRDAQKLDLSSKLYNYTIDISYDEDTKNDSIFYSLWQKIYFKRFPEALKIISDQKLVEKYSGLSSKVKFWISYSLYMEGDYSISNHLFYLLIKNNPLNYYSIIAQNFLENTDQLIKDSVLNPLKNIPEFKPTDLNNDARLNLGEMMVWSKLNYSNKVEYFLRYFSDVDPISLLKTKNKNFSDDELIGGVYNLLLNNFNENKEFLSAFKYMSRLMDKDEFNIKCVDIKHLFPVDHLETIKKVTDDIDPLLILAIIRQESAFNTEAKSSVGATGLMQLMLGTAKSIERRANIKDLLDPKKNITYGTKYFSKLLKKFDGNPILALSSYNAGPTKVARWKKESLGNLEPFYMVEEIPYKETRLYVKLIYRNLYFYQLILNKQETTSKYSFKLVQNNITR